MKPVAFACPHCSTPLRVNDRSLLGRNFDCPDCRRPLVLRADASGRVAAVAGVDAREALAERIRPAWSRRGRGPMMLASASLALAAVTTLWIIVRDDDPASRAVQGEGLPRALREQPNRIPEAATPELQVADDPPISVPIADDPPAAAPVAVAEQDPAASEPIDVAVAPDFPTIDVAAQLGQPILEFSQEQPVEVRRLLRQIAELSAVPIDVSEVEAMGLNERLDRLITIVLRETTVGEILEAVTEAANLRAEIAEGVILVRPAEGSASDDWQRRE